jgi:UDP-N-acetylmuramyl pentapeptide phosphotransferase/UDP-N-acetylglucosamine-1-phosphate transferase
MLVIIALLVVPIYLLYTRVKASSKADTQFLDQDGTATCIGILLVFTLLFSAILSLFTRAKRHEILGAAAGYVFPSTALAVAHQNADTVPYWSYSWVMCQFDGRDQRAWMVFGIRPSCVLLLRSLLYVYGLRHSLN